MISWMQNNNKFTVIVMWVAALSFILAGAVGGVGGLQSNSIGKVGEVELKKDKFQMEYSNLYNRYNQMMQGKFDDAQAKQMGLQNQVIQNMAAQAKILNLAKEFGIIVTDEETGAKLASYPAFQTDGKFDRKAYDTYIQSSQLTNETFEDNLKEQLIIEKTFNLLNTDGVENEYKAFQLAFEVADKLKYTLLTKEDVNVTVTDEKLKQFWEPRKDQFKTAKQYTLDIQWTETKDTEVTDEEVKAYYDENRFNYTDKDGKISEFKDVKEWVKDATKIAKSKKSALKRYVEFKKGELKSDETITLDINDPKLSKELWDTIETKEVNDLLKPKVIENRYASVKIVNIVNPITQEFSEIKEKMTPLYQEEAEKEALSLLAEEKLTNIDKLDLNVSSFITLDNAETQKLGINQQETANFISKLFTSDLEKGIIPIGSKVMVYKIIEQKLISLESNETNIMHENANKVKNQSFQTSLMKALEKKYPTTLY
ncbi:MAG: Peptidyl-prolyl cis-trans isomerase PpiD (EC [uncultured Sulfurovum sp.]|uniref:Peptidyl-prolyl cis-trans isomerase PpiD (EC) n=1 Tax=uncultured Sulfurovum sp. TaxID=269237 RepID=A0A6S6SUU5_9BACT|nr:MAG: Peptidyl-prolyl cis-trans isomerase PpiD (EC [uncultured Sulfurovum sp.]